MPLKWSQNWVNSPYYHIIYSQKNDDTAELFIDNRCSNLKPTKKVKIVDIAFWRGGQAIYFNKKSYGVTGTNISLSTINFARAFKNNTLHLYVHDTRRLIYINYFYVAICLFNRFGNLKRGKDHLSALVSLRKSLSKDGLLVLDYINSEKITEQYTGQEAKHLDGISFNISKKVLDRQPIKTISFEHKNKDYYFQEERKAFHQVEFKRLFHLSGLSILNIFGDYNLYTI